MLWGWDATESSASIETKTFEDDLGDIQEETFYKFTAASYRNYDNKKNDKNIINWDKSRGLDKILFF